MNDSYDIEARRQEMNDFVLNGYKTYYDCVGVDVVILGYHDKNLKILIQRPHGMEKWMLIGGYVLRTETLERAALRTVYLRTRLRHLTLYPFKDYSQPDRVKDNTYDVKRLRELSGIESITDDNWLFQNFISHAFVALTDYSKVQLSGDYLMEDCQWVSLSEVSELLYDHNKMVDDALQFLKFLACTKPMGMDLLPDKFTIPEIHALYETILQQDVDSRNLTKKLTRLGLIVKTGEKRIIGAHRSPFLYTFDRLRYQELTERNEMQGI